MKQLLILILISLTTACGRPAAIPVDVQPIVNQIIINYNIPANAIDIVLKPLEGFKNGECNTWVGGREIVLDSRSWSQMSEQAKTITLLHELGHCVYNRGHSDEWRKDDNDCPKSIMYKYSLNTGCFRDHEQDYINELKD